MSKILTVLFVWALCSPWVVFGQVKPGWEAEWKKTVSRNDRQAMDWLAVGKFSICLLCGRIRDAKAQGLPVDEFETVKWKENRGLHREVAVPLFL